MGRDVCSNSEMDGERKVSVLTESDGDGVLYSGRDEGFPVLSIQTRALDSGSRAGVGPEQEAEREKPVNISFQLNQFKFIDHV